MSDESNACKTSKCCSKCCCVMGVIYRLIVLAMLSLGACALWRMADYIEATHAAGG